MKPKNYELRKVVLHLYSLGYSPRMIADKVAELTGKRYSRSYIRALLHRLKKEGALSSAPGASAWDELYTLLKAAHIRLTALADDARHGKQTRVEDIEAAKEHVEKALLVSATLRRALEGVRVVRQ